MSETSNIKSRTGQRPPGVRAVKKAASVARNSNTPRERREAMALLGKAGALVNTDAQKEAARLNGINGGRPQERPRVVCQVCKVNDRRTVRRVVVETETAEGGGKLFTNGHADVCRGCCADLGASWAAGDLLYSIHGPAAPGSNREASPVAQEGRAE